MELTVWQTIWFGNSSQPPTPCWLISQWLTKPFCYLICFCLTTCGLAGEPCLHCSRSLFYYFSPARELCWLQKLPGEGSRQEMCLHFWYAQDTVVWWCYWEKRSEPLTSYKLITCLESGGSIMTNITPLNLGNYQARIIAWFVLLNEIAVGIHFY